MEIGSSLWMVLRVTLVNGATSHPWGWCQGLSLWILPVTLVCMMLFSAFCFSVILVFSGNGGLFWVFFCTHFIWLPQHLQLVVPEHNQTWGKLIRIVINYEMGVSEQFWVAYEEKASLCCMTTELYLVQKCLICSILCSRLGFRKLRLMKYWLLGTKSFWFFNLFTLQISRFCIHPSLRVEGKV